MVILHTCPGAPRPLVRFGGANPKTTQVAKGVSASHSTAASFSDLAAAGVEATTTVPMRYFRHGSRSRPNTDTP
jgi:hypothetical protein